MLQVMPEMVDQLAEDSNREVAMPAWADWISWVWAVVAALSLFGAGLIPLFDLLGQSLYWGLPYSKKVSFFKSEFGLNHTDAVREVDRIHQSVIAQHPSRWRT